MNASRISARLAGLAALVALALPGAAGAQSVLGARPIAGPSDVVQVRDGCGPGMRFSERRQACVEDFDRGPPPPPPPRYYEERGPRYVAPPPPPRRYVDCGPGKRFSERMQGCVWIDGPRRSDDDAAAGAIAGGLIGAAIGAAAASGDRDDNRGRPVRGRIDPAPPTAAQAAKVGAGAPPAPRAAPPAQPGGSQWGKPQ